jgi:aryl carrier-like protein/NRPS condensation-like uncharacterized protein
MQTANTESSSTHAVGSRIHKLTDEQKRLLESLLEREQLSLDEQSLGRAPASPLEEILMKIWSDALKTPVGPDDNYFQVGGDSILSLRIVMGAKRAGLDLAVNDIFEHPTIAEIAQLLTTRPTNGQPSAAIPMPDADPVEHGALKVAKSRGLPVEGAFSLTSLQEGMLFHAMGAKNTHPYISQFSCILMGNLDIGAFTRAWEAVIRRHPALRCAFLCEHPHPPAQLVYSATDLPSVVSVLNWHDLDAAQQAKRWNELLKSEWERGFELTAPPLMRVILTSGDAGTWRTCWTHHHLILDGWSQQHVLQDVFAAYDAEIERRVWNPPPPPAFSEFIAWLATLESDESQRFWTAYLDGVTTRPLSQTTTQSENTSISSGLFQQQFSKLETASIRAFCRKNQITLSTLFVAAWAITLSAMKQQDDVLMGVTVSGRPTALSRVEEMVGSFINTVPVRIRLPLDRPITAWLADLQKQQAEVHQFSHNSLIQVRRWAKLPADVPLFDSILVFEGLRPHWEYRGLSAHLRIAEVQFNIDEDFPLIVVVDPREELLIQLRHDPKRISAAVVEAAIHTFARVVHLLVADENSLLAQVREPTFVEFQSQQEAILARRSMHQMQKLLARNRRHQVE